MSFLGYVFPLLSFCELLLLSTFMRGVSISLQMIFLLIASSSSVRTFFLAPRRLFGVNASAALALVVAGGDLF